MKSEKKIIVSSKVLGKYLMDEMFEIDEKEEYIPIKIEKDTLAINGSDNLITVHKKGSDNWIQDISYKKLSRIVRVLKAIEEQPIVLDFNTFITIKQIDF